MVKSPWLPRLSTGFSCIRGVTQEDALDLPALLREDLPRYQRVLALDPYKTRKVPSHGLKGELAGYRALEITCNEVAYRLVYRIYDAPAPRRLLVLSFAEHDPAYERALVFDRSLTIARKP